MPDIKWMPNFYDAPGAERRSLSYDASTGILGIGYRYGERSFNGAPLYGSSPNSFWGSAHGPLYNPFLGLLRFAK
jgi:hypothetical protein